MPTDYDIGAAFAAIEDELISSMMRNLRHHRAEETAEGFQWSQWQVEQLDALETYKRQSQKKYGKQFRSINRKLEKAIRAACAEGEMEQEEEILGAIREGFSARKMDDTLSGSFFKLNDRKLDALIRATTGDMEKAETAVLRRANDQYRKIIFNAQVYANTGAGTYEKAVDMATKEFLAAGLQCVVYRNGARHTLSDYADMALRTASKRAYLQGEGAKRQEWGISTVIINKRGGACPKCARFCGKVFIDDVWSGGKKSDGHYPLLSSAIAQGLYHPRCKDGHSTFFPGITQENKPWTQEELAKLEQKEQQEQKQHHAKRQAEKYRRLEQYALDAENGKKYGQRAVEWEKVAGLPERDIIQEIENRITSPTEDSIAAIPRCAFSEFTGQENVIMQEHFRTVLREVMKHPAKTEVAAIYDLNLNQIGDLSVGGELGCHIEEQEKLFFSIHNHPSGQFFSFSDIKNFLSRPYQIGTFVVGNNGAVYGLQKTINSDIVGFSETVSQAQKRLEAYAGDSLNEILEIMEQPLKEAEQYGFIYTKAPPSHR